MAKRVTLPVSGARARLFELADLVRTSPDETVVVLEHRGSDDHVALVREAHLTYLETRVRELEKHAATPFTLAGSLSSELDDGALDATLRAIRQEWAAGSPGARARRRS